jgi:CheY-like chemotaxis protein
MTGISILWLGDARRPEFRPAERVLVELGALRQAADARQAIEAMAEGSSTPDVIVVAQAYPGQFPPAELDGLRRRAPLARVVLLLGSWCEGEMRSGRPSPGVIRIYWHQAPARSERQLRRILAGRDSIWDLPATATEEERLLAASTSEWPRTTPLSPCGRGVGGEGVVVIVTRRAEMQGVLAAVCRECGYATVWLREPEAARVEGAAAAIFDASDAGPPELDEIRHLSAALAPAPIVVLMDFPRIDDLDRLLSAGVSAILAKPLHVDDLAWTLGCGAPAAPSP